MAIPMLWRAIGRARAVHVHEHLYIGSLLALLIGRIRRKRVVLTQHMGSLRLPSRPATTLYTLGARILAWPAMRLASHVAFVSANVSRFFGSTDAPGARGSLIFNGLDNETFAFADEHRRRESRARLGLGAGEPSRSSPGDSCARRACCCCASWRSVHMTSSGCSPGGDLTDPALVAPRQCRLSRPTVAAGSCTGAGSRGRAGPAKLWRGIPARRAGGARLRHGRTLDPRGAKRLPGRNRTDRGRRSALHPWPDRRRAMGRIAAQDHSARVG